MRMRCDAGGKKTDQARLTYNHLEKPPRKNQVVERKKSGMGRSAAAWKNLSKNQAACHRAGEKGRHVLRAKEKECDSASGGREDKCDAVYGSTRGGDGGVQ